MFFVGPPGKAMPPAAPATDDFWRSRGWGGVWVGADFRCDECKSKNIGRVQAVRESTLRGARPLPGPLVCDHKETP